MRVLVLSRAAVEEHLPMRDCIELMAETLADLSRGAFYQPLRTVLRPPRGEGVLAVMPAARIVGRRDTRGFGVGRASIGVKTLAVFPSNPARGLDAHQGTVTLLDGTTGEPRAILDASAVTAVRTAAVSAVATRALARSDASQLAVLGAGVQARSHIIALSCARKLTRVRVASRNPDGARRLAAEMAPQHPFPIEAVATPEEAVRSAGIVVTATTSREPVIERRWLSPGCHINAVGSCVPTAREIDTETMREAAIFVDRRESARSEAGDLLLAGIGDDRIRAELGDVLAGTAPGRANDREITLFESLGLAVEDLACAERVYERAAVSPTAQWVEL